MMPFFKRMQEPALRNVLIISLQGIGNTLMAMYAAEKLAEKTPCKISAVVSSNSRELALLLFPENRVWIWDETKSIIKNVGWLLNKLRQNNFDEVYLAYPSGKREGIIGLFAKAKLKKVICDGDGDWKFLRKFYKPNILKPANIHDINAIIFLFGMSYQGRVNSGWAIRDRIKETFENFANQFLVQNGLSNQFIIALHPGSKGSGKRWPAQRYIRLCKDMGSRFGCKFLILGGKEEALLKQKIVEGIGENAVLCNANSIIQATAILQRCQLFLGNDSAPMHLAAILGIPVIALWGYTDFFRTSPYGPGNIVIRMNYPCSPCYKFSGKYIDNCHYQLKCISKIPFENVIKIVSKYIGVIQGGKSEISIEDINSLNLSGVDNILSLDHGCIVINFSEA